MTDSEIFDVRVEATFFKPFGDLNGTNLQGTDIVIKGSFFMYIPKRRKEDQHNLLLSMESGPMIPGIDGRASPVNSGPVSPE
jgi:hypothetical protein